MGFTPPKTVYRLDFEDTELDGLEVRMRGGNLGQTFGIGDLVGVTEENATPEDAKAILRQYEEIAKHLVSWNVEDENKNPVPADLEGLKTLETRHVNMIVAAWQRAQADVPGPLSKPSSSTRPPELLSIPMEPLTEPRAS